MSQQIRCEWCSTLFPYERSGRGQEPRYCSPECKHEAQNSLAANRMRQLRRRQWEQNPPRRGPGRPRGS